jgi:hypothetical protein
VDQTQEISRVLRQIEALQARAESTCYVGERDAALAKILELQRKYFPEPDPLPEPALMIMAFPGFDVSAAAPPPKDFAWWR